MKPRLLAVTFLLCAGLTLSAQQYKSLTGVSLFKVAPLQVSAFVEKGKAFAPVLDKLLDAGLVTAYGIDVDMLCVPGENNVAFWYDTPNFATMQKAEDAIEEFQKANPKVMADLIAMADMTKHSDHIIGARVKNKRNVPAGARVVNDEDEVHVKPERMEEFLGLFEKYEKPVLEKLLADGVIYWYELDTQVVHTQAPGLVALIVLMPDLGTKDKVRAAFDESFGKLPGAERTTAEKLYYEMIDFASHRDMLSESVVFKSK